MRELRQIIAANIASLRQSKGMTQFNLAEKLNYSDKAVSKWERAESIPDIFILKTIADLFGVTVDYLLTDDHSDDIERRKQISKIVLRNRMMVSFLATMLVWLIATVTFVILNLAIPTSPFPFWLVFMYALPTSMVVMLIFNSIWGRKKLNYVIITVITWSVLCSLYVTFYTTVGLNIWLIYVIGIPVQVILFLCSGINNPEKYIDRRKERRNDSIDVS